MAWRFWHLPSVMNLIGCGTDQEPAKVCRRGLEGEENQNENQSKSSYHCGFSLWISDIIWWISMDFWSLMDLSWFVSFFLSTFDVVVQGNTPTTLFSGGVEEIPWSDVSLRNPKPTNPAPVNCGFGMKASASAAWKSSGKKKTSRTHKIGRKKKQSHPYRTYVHSM